MGKLPLTRSQKFHERLADLKDSQVLKDVLELAEKIGEAERVSPDSRLNMPPIRRARIDKEKEKTILESG